LPSRTPLEATWGPPKTPLLLLLPEEVRRRNGRLPLLLAATTTGIIVSCDDAPAIIISIKGVLLFFAALRARASFDFWCGFSFRARCLFVGGVSQPQSTDSLNSSLRSLLLSLSLSASRPLGCSHGSENAKTKTKKKVKNSRIFSNLPNQKKRGKRVVSAKRETSENLL